MFAVSEWSTGQTRLFVEDHKLAGFLIVHGSELGENMNDWQIEIRENIWKNDVLSQIDVKSL